MPSLWVNSQKALCAKKEQSQADRSYFDSPESENTLTEVCALSDSLVILDMLSLSHTLKNCLSFAVPTSVFPCLLYHISKKHNAWSMSEGHLNLSPATFRNQHRTSYKLNLKAFWGDTKQECEDHKIVHKSYLVFKSTWMPQGNFFFVHFALQISLR